MERLTELSIKHGTDKALIHKFTMFYEPYFEEYINKNPSILEIGVFNGSSLRAIQEYYDNKLTLVGFDINSETKHSDSFYQIRGDQSKAEDLQKCVDVLNGDKFDIILDDGSHMVEHQQFSFIYLFDYVKSGGVYMIEDLHTSFHKHYNPNNIITTYDFLKKLQEKENPYSPYLNEKDFDKLINQIDFIRIYVTPGSAIPKDNITHKSSVTSVIGKK